MEEKKIKIKTLKKSKIFIDYSQTIDDVYGNLKDYNPIHTFQIWKLIKN